MKSRLIGGLSFGQMPPIAVDAKGKIWYLTPNPILRAEVPQALSNNLDLEVFVDPASR
jgi:hypothetical protein